MFAWYYTRSPVFVKEFFLDGAGNFDIIAGMAKCPNEDYAPIIEPLVRTTCYNCGCVFSIIIHNKEHLRKQKRFRIKKSRPGVVCPWCHTHLLPNALARNERKNG